MYVERKQKKWERGSDKIALNDSNNIHMSLHFILIHPLDASCMRVKEEKAAASLIHLLNFEI